MIDFDNLDMPLDQGIEKAVRILNDHGVETFESCEGGPGHACPEPMVRFNGNAFEGFKAYAVAKDFGLDVLSLAYEYSESEGWLQGPYWKMTFRTPAFPIKQSEPVLPTFFVTLEDGTELKVEGNDAFRVFSHNRQDIKSVYLNSNRPSDFFNDTKPPKPPY